MDARIVRSRFARDQVSDPTVAIETARADRAAAFRTFVDRRLDEHYRLAAVILGDSVEAEDAVHDAAVLAWRRWSSLRDRNRFDAWFGRILVNVCRDRLRRRRRVQVVDLSPVDDVSEPDRTGGAIDRVALSRAMSELDAEHRIVLVLRYFLDLPVDAVADRLGVPAGTVKSRLHHALRRLRDALGSDA